MTVPPLGIDVAKDSYQVTLLLDGRSLRHAFRNDPADFPKLLSWLKRQHVTQVHACLEATGRYADDLALYLHDAGHIVSRMNPAVIRNYARSKLTRTKTDQVDADVIADFCRTQQPRAWTPPAPEVRELQALVRHRETLVANRVQERNRLASQPPAPDVCHLIEQHLLFLDQQIAHLEQLIRDHINRHPHLRQQHDLLGSIPGIGDTTAALLIATNLPAFDDARAAVAFVGLSPAQRRSGTSLRGRDHLCKIGDSDVRKALYLPALAALRCNPAVRALADRLERRGKLKMVIVGAAMRKLLCLAYGVLKSGRPFDPNYSPASAAAA